MSKHSVTASLSLTAVLCFTSFKVHFPIVTH